MFEKSKIEKQLKTVIDPYLQKDYVSAGAVKAMVFKDNHCRIDLELGFATKHLQEAIIQRITEALSTIEKLDFVDININTHIKAHAVQSSVEALKPVKNIIAVASGKGGVGKSTTAVNLALALAHEGAQVGLLDADIYGPNQPQMLGCELRPQATEDNKLKPVIIHGIQTMSIGYLIQGDDTPMVWRGPMVSTALQQLLRDTQWQDLDYLIIDLPPGTGDIQLTLAQKIPVSGAIVVTTPQDIALLDVTKAIRMFEKVKIPSLGLVENMSLHTCSQCGHQEAIFGEGGAKRIEQDYGIELLGQLPLNIEIRQALDQGKPSVMANPEGPIAQHYIEIARRMAAKLSLLPVNKMAKFPKIVVEQG